MKEHLLQDHVYHLMKKLIYKTVHLFQRKHGGDFEELLSEAHYHYSRAINNYDPNGSYKLSSHIYLYVWNGLLDTWRTQANRQRSLPRSYDYDLESFVECERFDMDKFCIDLSPDAEIMVRQIPLIDGSPRNKAWAVAEYFLDMGWSATRIAESFQEILEALS